MPPLQQSELIKRKQLYLLSGGGKQPKNPLQLATPISYTGGAALAAKKKFVAHITVKEKNNLPLPTDSKDDFILWRIRSGVSERPKDFEYIAEKNDNDEYKHQKGIPLFWQPDGQENNETKVQYCGHWTVKNVKYEQKDIMDKPRCGKLTLKFDRFDEQFSKIITKASTMSEAEIIDHDWDAVLEDPDDAATDNEKPVAAVKNDPDEESQGEMSQGALETPESKDEAAVKAEDDQTVTKTEDDSSSDKKKDTQALAHKSNRTPETIVLDDSPVAIAAAEQDHSSRKRRRHCDVPEDERASRPNPAAARVAAIAAPRKRLSGLTKHELAELVASKGEGFKPLATTLKDADFNGKRIVEQLEKGEELFLEFLQHHCGLENMLYRMSVMGTFKDNLNE